MNYLLTLVIAFLAEAAKAAEDLAVRRFETAREDYNIALGRDRAFGIHKAAAAYVKAGKQYLIYMVERGQTKTPQYKMVYDEVVE